MGTGLFTQSLRVHETRPKGPQPTTRLDARPLHNRDETCLRAEAASCSAYAMLPDLPGLLPHMRGTTPHNKTH